MGIASRARRGQRTRPAKFGAPLGGEGKTSLFHLHFWWLGVTQWGHSCRVSMFFHMATLLKGTVMQSADLEHPISTLSVVQGQNFSVTKEVAHHVSSMCWARTAGLGPDPPCPRHLGSGVGQMSLSAWRGRWTAFTEVSAQGVACL